MRTRDSIPVLLACSVIHLCGLALAYARADWSWVHSVVQTGAKSKAADDDHKTRASELRASGMTLVTAIQRAEPVGGGPALFVNAAANKQDGKFAVKVECYAAGALELVRVTPEVVKKAKEGRESKYSPKNPGKIAAAMKSTTLVDAINIALREKPGDAIIAEGYEGDGGNVLIDVRIVSGDTLWTVTIDPASGRVSG